MRYPIAVALLLGSLGGWATPVRDRTWSIQLDPAGPRAAFPSGAAAIQMDTLSGSSSRDISAGILAIGSNMVKVVPSLI